MFLVPDPDNDRMYRDQVIVFGASYKSVEQEWEEWLLKFEAILKKLYWTSVIIHLDAELAGPYTYEWVVDMNLTDTWFSGNLQPSSQWSFKGGPRKFYENGIRIVDNL
jgi:hypothetical protein